MSETLDVVRFENMRGISRLAHGIFGRAGGCSPAPWDALNVGSEVGDEPARVLRNYARICAELDIKQGDLTTVRQVHGNCMQRVGEADRGRLVGSLDGLITDTPGVALSLRFADCTPIMVYDPAHHALGVAHAGWRGTVSKIAVALVEAMVEAFNSRPAELLAGIGPSIGPCCYEVGSEVIMAAQAAFERDVERRDGWPLLFSNGSATYLDLWAANRVLLESAGVTQVETTRLCTACHRDRFFSHRGDKGRTGRFAMVAVLRP